MSKGFSAPDPRQAKFIARLSKALKSRNGDRLGAIIDWGYKNLGNKAIANILVEVCHDPPLPGIDNDDVNFFWEWKMELLQSSPMWPEVADKARDCVASILVEEGFTPGKDFSIGKDGELIINQAAKEQLMSQVPESERGKIEKEMSNNTQEVSLEAIAVAVGVDRNYFTNLLSIAKRRLAPYVSADDGYFVLNYAMNFIEGTQQKFPELKDTNFDSYVLGQLASPESMMRILGKADQYSEPTETCTALEYLWKDIAEATGIATGNEFAVIDGANVLGIDAFKLIGKVWESEKIPMREMVCLLQKRSR